MVVIARRTIFWSVFISTVVNFSASRAIGATGLSGLNVTVPNRDLIKSMEGGPEPLKQLLTAHLREYPGSFPHKNIIYMPNLDKLLFNQYRLWTRLSGMESYQADMKTRRNLLNLVIRVNQSYEFTAADFDRTELIRFEKSLQSYVSQWSADTLFSELAKAIGNEFAEYRRSRDRDWYDFDGRYFEEKVVTYVIAYGITNKGENLESLTPEMKVEEGQIDYLAEEAVWKPALEQLRRQLDPGRRDSFKYAFERIMDRWESKLKGSRYSSTSERKMVVPEGTTLNVFEVHPHLAILRGFVGNDCSTDVSFGFPYSPFERNFYVADAQMNFLGYVALSIVELRGQRSLFFHTIAGPQITHQQADLLMRAFYSIRKTVGGQYMVLPEDHRIGENINFHAIDEMMRKYVRGVPEEKVKWLDVKYREIIGEHGNDMFYDSPVRNEFGRLYDQPTENIQVKMTKKPFVSPIPEPLAAMPEPECRYYFY